MQKLEELKKVLRTHWTLVNELLHDEEASSLNNILAAKDVNTIYEERGKLKVYKKLRNFVEN